MKKEDKLLSLILLSYCSENRITLAYYKVKAILEKEKIPFEFIVMDDGSKDNSYNIALELEKKESNVRAYQLSKNYTSHYSMELVPCQWLMMNNNLIQQL
jgi:glycosyltransferase involved in cell wall biosynthesis